MNKNHPYGKEKEWGVVQKFEIEADTFKSLVAACMIGLSEYRSATGYRVVKLKNDLPVLEILWTLPQKENEFLSEISDPVELAEQIYKWLNSKGIYDNAEQHDTDGDLERGFWASNHGSDWDVLLAVHPEYIIYGK